MSSVCHAVHVELFPVWWRGHRGFSVCYWLVWLLLESLALLSALCLKMCLGELGHKWTAEAASLLNVSIARLQGVQHVSVNPAVQIAPLYCSGVSKPPPKQPPLPVFDGMEYVGIWNMFLLSRRLFTRLFSVICLFSGRPRCLLKAVVNRMCVNKCCQGLLDHWQGVILQTDNHMNKLKFQDEFIIIIFFNKHLFYKTSLVPYSSLRTLKVWDTERSSQTQ